MHNSHHSPDAPQPSSKGLDIFKIFNYVGGTLVFFGIAFFIGINWSSLNNFFKIFSTLGSAVAAYLVGVLFYFYKNKFQPTSSAFFMIVGLVLPIGLYVTFNILGYISNFQQLNIIIWLLCLIFFLMSHFVFKRTIFLLFSVIYATFLFLNGINFEIDQSNFIIQNSAEYEFLIIGISYICLGRYLDYDKTYPLVGPLYFLGALFILTASYSLGGMFCLGSGSFVWRLLTALFIILFFILSVPFKSKAFLYLSALFLVIYVTDLSSTWVNIFGNYGWPLMLILIGFVTMLIGYIVLAIRKKISKNKLP